MTFLTILAVGLILLVLHHMLTIVAVAMQLALLKAAIADGVNKMQLADWSQNAGKIGDAVNRAQRRNLFEKN